MWLYCVCLAGREQDHKQWRNIAFCLGQLSIGEKGFRKMVDMLRCYKDSLADPDILAFFQVTSHTCTQNTQTCPTYHLRCWLQYAGQFELVVRLAL